MSAVAVVVEERLRSALPGCDFADAYRAPFAAADARQAAAAVFDSPPQWVHALMSLRNLLVRPFGLKAGDTRLQPDDARRIGIFPILSESPQEVLLGLDDHHLDFRIAVSLDGAAGGSPQVTITTLVRTHNRLGRGYLALIMPFHRIIARTMLERAAGP